jgi:hypothetical protein
MIYLTLLAAFVGSSSIAPGFAVEADTLRLEVGSPEIDGRVFPSHRARNRSYRGEGAPPVSTWTNDLAVGDSAGTAVHRWVTRA